MTVASMATPVPPGVLTRQPSRLKGDHLLSSPLSTAASSAFRHRRFPSVVSPGLVLPPSLTSASVLPAPSSPIPHIPLSLARQHLSLITSDLSSQQHLQRQSLDDVAASYERWQAAALSHYEAVLAQVKLRANEHIRRLQLQLATEPQPPSVGSTAPSTSSAQPPPPPLSRPPSAEQRPTSSPRPSQPLPVELIPVAGPPLSDPSIFTSSSSSPLQSPPPAAAVAVLDRRIGTEAEAERLKAAEGRAAAAVEAGLTSSSLLPLLSLRSLHSSLSAWTVERSSLAAQVASIKAQQSTLQTEKARLTEWKERIRKGAEGGSEWEAAKVALVQAGAELKRRHGEYESRIAAYKEEEGRLKAQWVELTGEAGLALPAVDALGRLIASQEREETAESAHRQLSELTEAVTPASLPAVVPSDRAEVQGLKAALAAAQAELAEQQAETARLTRELQLTAAASSPSPPTSSPPSSSPCPSCPSAQQRISDLSAAIAESQAQVSALTALVSSSQSRVAELERQLSLPLPPAVSTAELEVANQDLSRLLDEAIRRHAKELADLRQALKREGEEAVATLERQQEKERSVWAEQVDRLQAESREAGDREGGLRAQLEGLEGQLAATKGELRDSTVALQTLQHDAATALQVRASLQSEVAALTSTTEGLTTQVGGLEGEVEALQLRLVDEVRRRKDFQMKFEDAKGKVRVYARVRPFSGKEVEAGEASLLRPGPNQYTIQLNEQQRDVLGHVSDKWREFTFDHVFHAGLGGAKANGAQADVWLETEAFAELSVQGINTCVFAYGQSGTGKTWTMSGQLPCEANAFSSDQLGLKPRMIQKVFQLVGEGAKAYDFTVSCYLVEIYLNALEDLFWKADTASAMRQSGQGKWPEAPELKVRVDGAKKKVQVDGVRVKSFTSAAAMLADCEEAEKFRRTRRTGLNEASSRSHLVFAIMVEANHRASGKTTKGKLSLVDLAGSERADKTNVDGLSQKAREAMLEEGVAINESLRMLKNVFRILGQQHVPVAKGKQAELVQYRGNMLTELMQDSLGGQAKTLMFVNVGPAASNINESLDSLQYGDLVKNITNEKVQADEDHLEQIRRLQEMLANYRQRLGKREEMYDTETCGMVHSAQCSSANGVAHDVARAGIQSLERLPLLLVTLQPHCHRPRRHRQAQEAAYGHQHEALLHAVHHSAHTASARPHSSARQCGRVPSAEDASDEDEEAGEAKVHPARGERIREGEEGRECAEGGEEV